MNRFHQRCTIKTMITRYRIITVYVSLFLNIVFCFCYRIHLKFSCYNPQTNVTLNCEGIVDTLNNDVIDHVTICHFRHFTGMELFETPPQEVSYITGATKGLPKPLKQKWSVWLMRQILFLLTFMPALLGHTVTRPKQKKPYPGDFTGQGCQQTSSG